MSQVKSNIYLYFLVIYSANDSFSKEVNNVKKEAHTQLHAILLAHQEYTEMTLAAAVIFGCIPLTSIFSFPISRPVTQSTQTMTKQAPSV